MSNITLLASYGNELVEAGFEVWLHDFGTGYLTYRDPATGAQGSLQYSLMEGWEHLMPITPSSRVFGSSMFLDTDTDPFTVAAAQECARLTNRNEVVGTQHNAGDRAWRSPDAIALHA